jgi:hypothetical protein
MTVYLGKNPVGVGRIVEKKVAKKKYGLTVDNLLGDVDANGNYVVPSEPFELNLAGVKSLPDSAFVRKFMTAPIKKFIANDLVSVGKEAMDYVAYNSKLEEVCIDSLETIESASVFNSAFGYCSSLKKASFAKLKKVSGNYALRGCFGGVVLDVEDVFPSLEEVSGFTSLENVVRIYDNSVLNYLTIKKITGASATYSSTFGAAESRKNTVWNFPSATEFTGYIWNLSASYPGEIHFAAANQAAIEACEGYSYKWGFAGATIYFDL